MDNRLWNSNQEFHTCFCVLVSFICYSICFLYALINRRDEYEQKHENDELLFTPSSCVIDLTFGIRAISTLEGLISY